ncbi:sphingosine-1-phosphate phosphatase 1 [Podarcis raffonei]|uniref:sphingosine-1-phosphate phosphatase 1 n=1 Tax=Podarcis raffonei TaxID=65483 RepID=UPI00232913A7|nr:sphingosine-1-phosphate phosphatase 1 [Podarcis raffonei]XP_053262436.1 sphingosine-1-phosphate phosphatase 1 [Podarcis raffonei]
MSSLRRLANCLQDSEKVAAFQRLCGVQAPPEWGAAFSPPRPLEPGAPVANGNCPATQPDGANDGRCRFQGPCNVGEKGDVWHSNGVLSGGACGEVEAQIKPPKKEEKPGFGVPKKQPRRNSLTGEMICQDFTIRSPFLYYLFSLGTELGNELFYILFFPFCIWNLDAWLGRRLIIVWVWVMYLGQCTKDLIRWPRPASPPVVKLEVFYNSEYSMPSTHAMSGTAIPVTLLLFSYGRWQYPLAYGLVLAICWCSLVCFSRIYMGMHSILDVIAGFLYALLILAVFLPLVDLVDSFNLTCTYAPLIIISLHLALGIFSFTLDTWSTSRGDTAQILGCGAGVACGSHVIYMLNMTPDPSPEMLPLLPPSLTVTLFGKVMLRLLIGVVILLLTKWAMKKVTIPLACKIFSIPCDDIRQARQRMEVELPYRYCTYGMVGFALTFLIPCLFHVMGLS